MSAQQRRLQEQMRKLGYQPAKKSQFQLKPVSIGRQLKTLPDIPITQRVEVSPQGAQKLQNIISTYRASNANIRITSKRTSIQRMSIKEQIKNYVKYQSSIQLDGLDALRNLIKNGDSLSLEINKSQSIEFFVGSLSDGHGEFGSQISSLITEFYIEELKKLFASVPLLALSLTLKDNLKKIYQQIEQKIIGQTLIDTRLSGASLLSLIIVNNMIYCSNLGDSKAAYYFKSDQQNDNPKEIRKFVQINLNSIHDTNSGKEVDRIIRKGGKIDQAIFKGQKEGSLKVWVPKQNYPGIKITRCFGNQIGKSIGISADPDFLEFKIPKSGYLLIASTGLWEKLDILMIDKILENNYPPESWADVDKATKQLGNETKKFWDVDGQGSVDISLSLVYISLEK
ncbi:unnamed protein product (macronuclear) [Paramecium tetraurelia]|uniref:protein-serine/threonine phosphatase n=1 Tax=Paramecium tetraurelia TaxID=5888 RepID=A0DFK1_PARTE|nr:uncharacterized protein GSPATT00016631001 [Paramecium tetraurelia]CAK81818.1 unnamed protein product [Paramecium tetraurelia]|eukprot:XP_001449215.1 hypothetical protein (macronuclear) [Paramecium tetraurelia strain d4-2]